MFTSFLTTNFYKFIKSGLLLDFYIKRMIYKILFNIFFILNILIGEKYLIEHIFLKLNNFSTYLYLLLNLYQKKFTYTLIILMWFLVLFIYLIIVWFTSLRYLIFWIYWYVFEFYKFITSFFNFFFFYFIFSYYAFTNF